MTGIETSMPPIAEEPLQETFILDAAVLPPGAEHFHPPEHGPEGHFCWTGPGAEAALMVHIARRYPLRAWLELADFGHSANRDALSLIVDGDIYPLLPRGPGKNLIGGPILPRDGDGPTQLIIRVPHLHSPPPERHRAPPLRGIAIKRLSLTPPN